MAVKLSLVVPCYNEEKTLSGIVERVMALQSDKLGLEIIIVDDCSKDKSWSVAQSLAEKYPEISGAWHMNKKYWNQLNLFGTLHNELIKNLICHSYNEVIKKLPHKVKDEKNINLLSIHEQL